MARTYGDTVAREALNIDRVALWQKDAADAAAISTVAFIAGAALVAGGAVLILVGGSSKSKTGANVTPALGGLQIIGRF